MSGVIKRERRVKRTLDKEGSQFEEARAIPSLIVRNLTPTRQMIHPGYQLTPSLSHPVIRIPRVVRSTGYRPPPPPGDASNPIMIINNNSDDTTSIYDTAPEAEPSTPSDERKKKQQHAAVKEAFEQVQDDEIRRID